MNFWNAQQMITDLLAGMPALALEVVHFMGWNFLFIALYSYFFFKTKSLGQMLPTAWMTLCVPVVLRGSGLIILTYLFIGQAMFTGVGIEFASKCIIDPFVSAQVLIAASIYMLIYAHVSLKQLHTAGRNLQYTTVKP